MWDLDTLVLPSEAEMFSDEVFTDLQREVMDAVWALTAGVGGAWCDQASVRKLVGRCAVNPMRCLVGRLILDQSGCGWARQPHSVRNWKPSQLVRFSKEGFLEYAALRGVFS